MTFQSEWITLGASTDLTNQLAYAARGIIAGINLYIRYINDRNGIDGRLIKFRVLDDLNDSQTSIDNMNRLLQDENVLAIIGNSGGAKVEAAIPIVTRHETVLFGAFATSASLYQLPSNPYVFNFMANPGKITAEIIDEILKLGIEPKEIGFFTEQSIVGKLIVDHASHSLKKAGFSSVTDVSMGSFALGSQNIDSGIENIRAAKNNLKVIIIGANAGVAMKFIDRAKRLFPEAIFVSINGFFTKNPDGARIIGNLYVPPLNLDDLPALSEFKRNLAKFGSTNDNLYYQFYGYLDAKLLIEGLRRAAKLNLLDRKGLVSALEDLQEIDIGINTPITFSKHNHQALNRGWLVELKKDENYAPFFWKDLLKKVTNDHT